MLFGSNNDQLQVLGIYFFSFSLITILLLGEANSEVNKMSDVLVVLFFSLKLTLCSMLIETVVCTLTAVCHHFRLSGTMPVVEVLQQATRMMPDMHALTTRSGVVRVVDGFRFHVVSLDNYYTTYQIQLQYSQSCMLSSFYSVVSEFV